MFIGDILIGMGLATPGDLAAARELQRSRGGPLGDCLVELGRVTKDDLEAVYAKAPASPKTLADVGVPLSSLLTLLVKAIYAASVETPTEVAELMQLPLAVVLELFEAGEDRQIVAVVGAVRADLTSDRVYALTKSGLEMAQSAMRRCEYIGPAPVALDAYRQQILRQLITHEAIGQTAIDGAFQDLVVSPELFINLGPAINSGRSILLYGPPGNGKTTMAERIGSLFRDIIFVPHCFEVDGQIIKVFDPLVHRVVRGKIDPQARARATDREYLDRRWEACRRPVITVGGELTLEMLDLGFNTEAKFYEAPLHIKALGGVLLIDDFGRQLVKPRALLNRWITPLEDHRDHLKLISGKSFALPFDELVVFATNLSPKDLMDAAFLRRIPYKIHVPAPGKDDFREIFHRLAEEFSIETPDEVVEHVVDEIKSWDGFNIGGYQPRFILEQLRSASRYFKTPMDFREDYLSMALNNLHTKDQRTHHTEADLGETHAAVLQ